MSVRVRRADDADVEAVVDLGAAVVPATYEPLSPDHESWCLERLDGSNRAAAQGFRQTHRTGTEGIPDLTWVWMRRVVPGATR